MAKLKLVRSPLEVLDITLPDGGELKLEIRNPTVKESKLMQQELIILDTKLKAEPPEITVTEYSVQTIQVICFDFDVELLEEVEVNHLAEISQAIIDLKKVAEDRKKKVKLSMPTKSSKSAG